MDLQEYDWWGSGDHQPPDHLKTKKQLRAIGLRPKQPVGVIRTNKYDCLLFNPNDSNSAIPKRKCSQKQLETLAKNRQKIQQRRDYNEWMRDWGFTEYARVAAVKWAKGILQKPDSWVILDTETTGLDVHYDQAIEIGVIDLDGNILLEERIKPTVLISPGAQAVHGICEADLAEAPTFPEIYPKILATLKDRQVIIYNASFDIDILHYDCKFHDLPSLKLSDRSTCLMTRYARWYGDYSDYWGDYKWQPLGGGHASVSDCRAALRRLTEIAADVDYMVYPKGIVPPE